ncbi:hypothetical protein ACOYW6_11420 [Parablastomonas sp. CN1-191]|uniref:hypothetical protein n=1 Tax=Parablastomonas sp. CN1-191 TaxID=3400908 RepID=UPI003BF7DAF6
MTDPTTKAPDPRRDYDSPEDLLEDIALPLDEREELLRQWKQDLEQRLEAESEGMSASDPISADKESKLAGEARRVTAALEKVCEDRRQASGS